MFSPSKKALAVIGIILCLFSSAFAYCGGSGEPNDPYQISNVSDWNDLMSDPNDWNKHFIMTADVNLQGVALTPVGNYDGVMFTGVFDGKGHVIHNVVINMPSSDYVGLFGYISSGGQINNLGVVDVNITGWHGVGGLVGENYSGVISACYTTGAVSSLSTVGSLAGVNDYGTIVNCYAAGVVSGGWNVGGLVGWNSGAITACYATGAVKGDGFVGGLVGINNNDTITGTITACYATGVVTGGKNSRSVGGLVGKVYGADRSTVINASFWDMETSGQAGSSGGKGISTSQMKSITVYQNAGWANKGWVISDGLDYPHLAWENTGGEPIPEPQPVPLSGSGTEEDAYQVWTSEDFAILSWYAGVLDKHIALMAALDLSGIVLYPIGDLGTFTGVFDGNNHIISKVVINQPGSDYVGLFSSLGYGHSCQINNLGVVDVNITGRSYVGGLVGYNYGGTITNCYAAGAVTGDYAVGGLVGSNNGDSINESIITKCYANGTVIAGGYGVGGLVGVNYYGTIIDCYATGTVEATGDGPVSSVGDLVGVNYYGTIMDCYATGAVMATGGDYVYGIGGLVGENYDTIMDCYATGAVMATGDDYVYYIGGLVGGNYHYQGVSSDISNCYSTGAVSGSSNSRYGYVSSLGGLVGGNGGSISNCYSTGSVSVSRSYVEIGGLVGLSYGDFNITTAGFWDIETSGRTTSAGGTGKTTAEMQDINTFLNAGWDFVGETANGTEDIWTICEGISYPKFTWQNQLPTAEAGPDQTVYAWIDGIAEVDLDGSGSSDADGCNGLTYHWSWTVDSNTYGANGVNPIIELPIGGHTIQLIVNDGLADSVPDDVNITIIAPLKGMLNITPCVINRSHHRPENILAFIRLPEGITKKDIDSNEPLVLYPGEIEASSQRIVFVPYGFGRHRKWLVGILAFFDKDDVLDAISTNGRVELKVAGELTSGQYFYGSDTVVIIGPRRPCYLPKK